MNAKIVNFIVLGVFLLPVGQFVILVKLNVLNGHKMDVVGAVGGNKWAAPLMWAATAEGERGSQIKDSKFANPSWPQLERPTP